MNTTVYEPSAYCRMCRLIGFFGALAGHGGLVILVLLLLSQSPTIPLPSPVEATVIVLQVVAPQKRVSQPAPVEPAKPVRTQPVPEPVTAPSQPAQIEQLKPEFVTVSKPALQSLQEKPHTPVLESTRSESVPAPEPIVQKTQAINTEQTVAALEIQARQTLLSYLVAQIEKHKRYPSQARRRGIEGVVRMKVSIDSAGNLLSISVLDNGTDPLLAKATQSVANKIQDKWEISGSGTPVSVIVPLRYSLVE